MTDEWLDELDTAGKVVELSDAVAALLVRTELVEVRPQGCERWLLLPRGKVGAARIDDFQLEVRPKGRVRLEHLLFLLGYAKDPGFRSDVVEGQGRDELWPALGFSLAQSLERALALGVLQGYQTKEEALRTVRGRIRFGDQIKARPGLLVPIEVTYDDYTPDTVENRILLAAIRTMLGVPRLNPAVRRRLLHLTGKLEGVQELARGARIPAWQPTRLNARYHHALRLAEIVLRYAAAEPGPGGIEVASFVVTMWEVFEQFVTTALTEALRRAPGRVEAQMPARLAGPGDWRRGTIPMQVDIVYRDEFGLPRMVFDAKYKAASKTGEHANADHYQMLAYCTALQVPRAWLVYAGGPDGDRTRLIKNTSIEIVEYPLDLSQSPAKLLAQIDQLAERALDLLALGAAVQSHRLAGGDLAK